MKVKCSVCEKEYIIRGIQEQVLKDFPDHSKNHIICSCPNFKEHYNIIRTRKYNEMPIELKQKILDKVKSGMKFGEIAKHFKIDTDMVCTVIDKNLINVSYLRDKVIEK